MGMWMGNTVTKDEEKTEALNVFFALVFYRKIKCPQGEQPPELLNRKEDQNRLPVTQEEMTSHSHLATHKSLGPYVIHPRRLRELMKYLSKPLHHL